MEKNILLKKLTLTYFKGIKAFEINLSKENYIEGDNATGKTTLFDAFCWILFGKDSEDNKTFNIKTLDKNNKAISKVEHTVEAVIQVNDEEIVLQRIYKEKWRKKQGEIKTTFVGHEVKFSYNGVPVNQTQFNGKIAAILDERLFKLLTNPLYFNNELPWKERRTILISLVGEVTEEELLKLTKKEDLDFIKSMLNRSETIEEIKREYASKRKLLKEALKQIPTRIDEVQKGKPQPVNNEDIEAVIGMKQAAINSINEEIDNYISSNEKELTKVQDIQKQLNTKKLKLQTLKNENETNSKTNNNELENSIEDLKLNVSTQNSKKSRIETQLSESKTLLSNLTVRKDNLIKKWKNENTKTINLDPSKASCGICKLSYKEITGEDPNELLLETFNKEKLETKKLIEEQGDALNIEIKEIETTISSLDKELKIIFPALDLLKSSLESKEQKLSTLSNVKIEDTQEIIDLIKEINDFVVPEIKVVDNSEKRQDISDLNNEIQVLKTSLNVNVQIENADNRIKELTEEEEKKASELAGIEKKEFALMNFEKSKITQLENKINSLFSNVNFKMFKPQINGGEEEICECLVFGVPFSDANTAAKINAGIDIINALSKFYKVNAPIWIDNRESVIKLIATESQVINLSVKEGSKLLLKK